MSNPYISPNPYDSSSFAESRTDGPISLTWLLFSFDGRITRTQLWSVWFCLLALMIPLYTIAILLSEDLFNLVVLLSLIPTAWIGLALEVKRWHDLGKSGFWFFIGLVPYIGGLIKLVMLGFFPSDGPNEYDQNTF